MVCPPQATREVAALAAGIKRLQAFIYISTCYVNIEEAMYPLVKSSTGRKLQHAELAAKLAQMAPAKAEKAVSPDCLMQQLYGRYALPHLLL